MSKKKLLSENEIRRFQGLAGIPAIGEMHCPSGEREEEELEELGMDHDGARHEEEPELPGDEGPEDELEMDVEMDASDEGGDLDLSPDQYGRVKITCAQTPPNTILEIFNEKGTIAQKSFKDSIQINFIHPGDYNIRAFQDLNGDRVWTSGKLGNNTLPEPIMVYPEQINIRKNWIVELKISPPR